MKKGLCIFLSTAMIVLSFAACTKKGDNKSADVTTQTNANGEVYVNVTDKNGEAVTNADGEAVTSVLSSAEKSKIEASSSKAAAGSTSASKPGGSISGTTSLNPIDITGSKDDLLDEGTTIKTTNKTTLRDSVIGKVVKTKKFTLQTSIISGGVKTPVTLAFNNENLCAEMTYQSIAMRMLIMDKKMYIVFPAMKGYTEITEEGFEGLGDLMSNITGDQTYVATTKVKDGSTTLICEEYKSSDGARVKYYFDGNTWKRWETESGSDISIFEVSSFSGNVDSSLFSLSGYQKIDLSSAGLSK